MSSKRRQKPTIHFLHPHPNGPIQSRGFSKRQRENLPPGVRDDTIYEGVRRYAVACHPTAKLPPHASNEPLAINCEACKKTPAFQEALAKRTSPSPDLVEAPPEAFPQGAPESSAATQPPAPTSPKEKK